MRFEYVSAEGLDVLHLAHPAQLGPGGQLVALCGNTRGDLDVVDPSDQRPLCRPCAQAQIKAELHPGPRGR